MNNPMIFIYRELLLNQNYLRVLPYELGKLFQLQVLGLHGNPLNKEVLALYGEPSGTHKLLSYMLDNLQGRVYPPLYTSFDTTKDSIGNQLPMKFTNHR